MPAIDPDLCAVIRCAYCGRFALDPPEAPPATDREAWEFLTEQHWPECSWVQTRAWSLSLRPGIHSRNGITYIQPEREDN